MNSKQFLLSSLFFALFLFMNPGALFSQKTTDSGSGSKLAPTSSVVKELVSSADQIVISVNDGAVAYQVFTKSGPDAAFVQALPKTTLSFDAKNPDANRVFLCYKEAVEVKVILSSEKEEQADVDFVVICE